MTNKRMAGQIKGGKWMVITESKGKEGEGYIHSCGTQIMGKVVYIRETMPYCPVCEEEPCDHGFLGTPRVSLKGGKERWI